MISSIKNTTLSPSELLEKIEGLHEYYMPINLNSQFHNLKVTATKHLIFILNHSTHDALQRSNIEDLVFCSLTLVYYFGMRLKRSRSKSKLWSWCGKRQFNKVEGAFKKTMEMLLPNRIDATIRITFNFFTNVSLWPFESFVSQILNVILYYSRGKTTLFNLLLTDIHCILYKDVNSARYRMRILYELLNSTNWVIDQRKLLPYVTRLLDFFAQSISTDDNKMKYLKKGFEICLRRITERVENQQRLMIITTMLNWFSMVKMPSRDILEISPLLYHAVAFYKVGLYSESFGDGVVEHLLMNLIGSGDVIYSVIGCRLLQSLMDRLNNSNCLVGPMIFYEFSQVQITIGTCNTEDKTFFRRSRDRFHNSLLKAIKCHNNNIVNVKIIYSVICSVILEIPCGLTAVAVAYLLMSIQDIALNEEELSSSSRYWLHATVISIMSLICWVHKAPVLYTYVNKIIARRAKEAPQLNPPLMHYYKIGRHQVTWNKPTFFFEDWELRYALWKQFQEEPHTLSGNNKKQNMKAPTLDLLN